MKKLVSMFLAFTLIFSLIPTTCFAASKEAEATANALNELGLFSGTGTDENGKPIYALDKAPTRHEAVTMLVRLLGKGDEAVNGKWDTPFTDVANWAKPYVGYAYANGLASGTSSTTFGGNDTVTAAQYITFILRALGYQSGKDFSWSSSWELSDELGITDGRYNKDFSSFTRGDVAMISYHALSAMINNTNQSLANQLYKNKIIPESEVPSLPFRVPQKSSHTTATDENGNILLTSWPYDGGKDLPMNFNYIDLVFNTNTRTAEKDEIYFYNLDSKQRIPVYSAAPGSTAKDAFIIVPNAEIQPRTKYYVYIPAGTIELDNGTTYNQDISIKFTRASH